MNPGAALTAAWLVVINYIIAAINVTMAVIGWLHHGWWFINIGAAAFVVGVSEFTRRRAYRCLEPNPILKSLHQTLLSGSPNPPPERSLYRLRWFPWPHLSPSPKKSRLRLKAPVVGYRAWIEPGLSSWNGTPWKVGTNKAHCRFMWPLIFHRAPSRWCGCGFNATHKLEFSGHAAGLVQCWGRIFRHEAYGFRAEYARPIAFIRELSTARPPALAALADQYHVPIIGIREATSFAKDYGISLAP